MVNAEIFWSKVDIRLARLRMTLQQMSEAEDIEYQTMAMQRNRRTLPKVDQLIKMADFFNTTIDELISDSYTPNAPDERIKRIARKATGAREEYLLAIEKLLDL